MTAPRHGGPPLQPSAVVLLTSYVWEGSAALHALIANDVRLTDLVLQRPWWGNRSWIRSRLRYTRVGLRNRLTPGPRRYHPLERTARRHGIAVHRIDDINTAGMQWAAENVRLIVVAGSRIIKPPVVARYQGKIINLHTGLLPYFRGPYSEFWAMYHQQHHRIGTSVHLIDEGIDTGPLLATRVADLPERPLTPQQAHHLNALQGTQLLAETVDGYLKGRLVPQPQPPVGATYTQPSAAEIAVVRQRLGRRIRVDFIE